MSTENSAHSNVLSYELIDSVRHQHTSVDAALSWARQYIEFENHEVVDTSPWATSLKLHSEAGDRILKMVPRADARQIELLQNISLTLPHHSPVLLMSHDENGWLLYEHHGGIDVDHEKETDDKKDLLISYANVQIAASKQSGLLGEVESAKPENQFSQLLSFLSTSHSSPALDGRVDGAFYLGAESANRYRRRLCSAADDIGAFLQLATPLVPILEHCNLSLQSASRRYDGQLVFIDWDDAAMAPPGLSLHSFFSGCHRPFLALQPPRSGRSQIKTENELRDDRMLLACYAKPLVDAGLYTTESLRTGLPASIAAGVMRNVARCADYPAIDKELKKRVAVSIKQRLDDLMELVETLSLGSKEILTELTSI